MSINEQAVWAGYELNNKLRRWHKAQLAKKNPDFEKAVSTGKIGVYDVRPGTVAGKKLLDAKQTNLIIARAVEENEGFWAGRMGYIEMDTIRQVLQHRRVPFLDHRHELVPQLCNNAGFFPNSIDAIEEFADCYLECADKIDLQGFWGLYMEDYFYKRYQPDMKYQSMLNWLEPWNVLYSDNLNRAGSRQGGHYTWEAAKDADLMPWTKALKGKRVLVIHPFADSIEKQYYGQARTHLFENIFAKDDILPEFELLTLKAVQTMGDTTDKRFKNWFEALDWMTLECENRKNDFDVAIIGCGAYGFPLAARVKQMGKVAIHMGGVTQMLFGIMGNRWERENPELVKKLVNEYWIRPSEAERPACAQSVESGCYW